MKNKISILGFLLLFAIGSNAQSSSSWGKYTLIAGQNQTSASLLDLSNATYHTWNFTGQTGYATYLVNRDTLVRSVKYTGVASGLPGGPICGEVQKVNWAGTILWDFIYSDTNYVSHHDICPMPNGNVLLISYEKRAASQLANAGCNTYTGTMWAEKIVEIQPTGATTGNVVWEWHVWDHLMQNANAALPNYVSSISAHPELMNINYNAASDWLHMNGIDYNAALDLIAFSSHNMSEVYVIDHSTTSAEAASHTGGNKGHGGDLLYRWGNPAAYGVSSPAADLNIVHDGHFVPAGSPLAGYLAGFNNNGQNGTSSYVDFFNPPMNQDTFVKPAAGAAFNPATYDKRIVCNGHAQDMGNSQQLPNGNNLICVATAGYVYELDSAGVNTLWSYQSSGGMGGAIPQAFRYTSCFISGTQPATPSVTQSGNSLSSSVSGTSYQWYLNGVAISGATAQNYSPTQSGNYQVQVLDAMGCGSALSTALAFSATGISIVEENYFWQIFPNPSADKIYLKASSASQIHYIIYNINGVMVDENKSWNTASPISLSHLQSGNYLISITTIDDTKHFGSFKFTKI